MKEPKTIYQYIKIMRMLDKTSISDKNGFELHPDDVDYSYYIWGN